jgi:hypothetical protein
VPAGSLDALGSLVSPTTADAALGPTSAPDTGSADRPSAGGDAAAPGGAGDVRPPGDVRADAGGGETGAPISAALPAPWIATEVGVLRTRGVATFADGEFTLTAHTTESVDTKRQSTPDSMHFVHAPLEGDGSLVARVARWTNNSGWSGVCVQMRASESPLAQKAQLCGRHGGSPYVRFFVRQSESDSAAGQQSLEGISAPPFWMKIERKGQRFTGYHSRDGKTWRMVDFVDLSPGSRVLAGMSVTNEYDPITGVFSDVQITNP